MPNPYTHLFFTSPVYVLNRTSEVVPKSVEKNVEDQALQSPKEPQPTIVANPVTVEKAVSKPKKQVLLLILLKGALDPERKSVIEPIMEKLSISKSSYKVVECNDELDFSILETILPNKMLIVGFDKENWYQTSLTDSIKTLYLPDFLLMKQDREQTGKESWKAIQSFFAS